MKPSHRRPSRGRSRRQAAAKPRRGLFRTLLSLVGLLLVGGLLLGTVGFGAYVLHLNNQITSQFEGKRWALPARVYARPLELYAGLGLTAQQLQKELSLLHYRAAGDLAGPGTYVAGEGEIRLHTRGFTFWDGAEPPRTVRVGFEGGQVAALESTGETLGLLRLEAAEIAGIYPSHHEDRILVRYDEIPPVLVDGLIAVEDRKFHEHWGIDPKGIFRAFLANLEAGRTVQGGSTLTQQLVKNYFLSNERTYRRKFNEMIMSMLLEWHYSKEEILQAYANEVYLGQDGNRAIHGLGLASQFYFGRPLTELNLPHMALLVGLVKGPSYYDPRRFPERALERRALVLDVMAEQNLISREDAETAKQRPLDVAPRGSGGISPYPGFIDLVQRQLRQNYREEDLTSEGLRIFTTLDPLVQAEVEEGIVEGLPVLEKSRGLEANILQAAAVVADTRSGEVLALVGGRDVRLAGFNRVLDAKRPAGSLLKPAVYLAALEFPEVYTLASQLDDSPLNYRGSGGQVWSPKNYSKTNHGRVMFQDALAKSYNIPTARIALDLTPQRIVKMLNRLGIEDELAPYPSLSLGAADLPPWQVAQMYETLASGGYRIPLRAIREVVGLDGEPLARYPLQVEQVVDPEPAYLITKAMQRVVTHGTATALKEKLSPELNIAGKTGTTDDYRDSWFAGFTGNRMAVVWVGRDDFKPTKLSGSTGAMRLWMDVMKDLNLEPLEPAEPGGVELVAIDTRSGLRASRECGQGVMIPFARGSAPGAYTSCAPAPSAAPEASYTVTREVQTPPESAPAPAPQPRGESLQSFFERLSR